MSGRAGAMGICPISSERKWLDRQKVWISSAPCIAKSLCSRKTKGVGVNIGTRQNEQLAALAFPDLLINLENSQDSSTTARYVLLLRKQLDKSASVDDGRLSTYSSVETYQILVAVVRQMARNVTLSLDGLHHLTSLLQCLSRLDKRFNIMFRTTGGLKVLSACVRSLTLEHPKIYQMTVDLLLSCCKSNMNVQILWKCGTITSVVQHITTVSSSRFPATAEQALRVVNRVAVKSMNLPSFVARGLTMLLLRMGRTILEGNYVGKSVIVTKILECIRLMLRTKTARAALKDHHGIIFIREIARTTVNEDLFNAASSVLLESFPPKKLPVPSLNHPLCLQSIKSQKSNDHDSQLNIIIACREKSQLRGRRNRRSYRNQLKSESCRSLGAEGFSTVTTPENQHVQTISPLSDASFPEHKKFFPELCSSPSASLTSWPTADARPPLRLQFRSSTGDFSLIKTLPKSSKKLSSSHSFPGKVLTREKTHLKSVFSSSKKISAGTEKQSTKSTYSSVFQITKKLSKIRLQNSSVALPSESLNDETDLSSNDLNLTTSDHSYFPYNRIAHPDLEKFHFRVQKSAESPPEKMAQSTNLDERRAILQHALDRLADPKPNEKVVYDADILLGRLFAFESDNSCPQNLDNFIRKSIMHFRPILEPGSLRFDSLFEGGNLRKAIQVDSYEYDLLLFSDVNRAVTGQWFYFQITNMTAGHSYRFNIVNCQRPARFFGYGMQPVVFSLKEATAFRCSEAQEPDYDLPNGGWRRAGRRIHFYRNNYRCHGKQPTDQEDDGSGNGNGQMNFYTLTFTLDFDHSDDVVYVAYHYPYSYSTLQRKLQTLESKVKHLPDLFYQSQILTTTSAGLPVPLLTITGNSTLESAHPDKKYVFLTGRVHPSESNASYVLHGILDFLTGVTEDAKHLRQQFVFKIVPMLNPDGVVCGNSRCCLVGQDLNRQWANPTKMDCPTIFHTKSLMQFVRHCGREIELFVDCHGHSNLKNVFFYGCSPFSDWKSSDGVRDVIEVDHGDDLSTSDRCSVLEQIAKGFPLLMKQVSKTLSLRNCSYDVQEKRETCARVVGWRELKCPRSYTLESSFCGFDCGPYQGYQMNTGLLHQVGWDLMKALSLSLADGSSADLDYSRQSQDTGQMI